MQNWRQHVRFTFLFWKAKAFWSNYLSELPFSIALWTVYTREIFLLVLLKIFWNFETLSKSTQKQPFSCVFQDRCPGKIRKLHKKMPVLESLFNKVSRNKETQAQVFSYVFCEGFTSNVFTEHLRWSWSLSLKTFYVVGVHKKVFE